MNSIELMVFFVVNFSTSCFLGDPILILISKNKMSSGFFYLLILMVEQTKGQMLVRSRRNKTDFSHACNKSKNGFPCRWVWIEVMREIRHFKSLFLITICWMVCLFDHFLWKIIWSSLFRFFSLRLK